MTEKKSPKKSGLVYNGGGIKGSRQGIPARDLSPAEVKKYGGVKILLETGLYEQISAPAIKVDKDGPVDQEVLDG